METPQTLKKLFEKYLSNGCSPLEVERLMQFFGTEDQDYLAQLVLTELEKPEKDITYEEMRPVLDRVYQQLQGQLHQNGPAVRRVLWPRLSGWPARIAIAASILLMLSLGAYFLRRRPPGPALTTIKPGIFKNDVRPGNRAILTLANGQKIAINTLPAGKVAHTSFRKTAAGAIVYDAANTTPVLTYNTFTVPRGGGKHSLQLADGTLALLDAGSSITFPVAFTGTERQVKITGRVYFEVVHDAAKPFLVSAKGETIQDIGTHFNVEAFDDEPGVKTTLLEGSVKVSGIILKPGQQLATDVSGKASVIKDVDEEAVMAWKNDLFKFTDNASLHAVMNELSRWYDLDVVYQGADKDYHFGGFMSRNSNLTSVLKILQISGVRFSLDGKKLTVYQ